ncbi:hypothetical protein SAMN05443635_10216 [Roseobacter denitrificans OCh 114]|nr:hypothetical protein SAMN05443635_10216 [Roseobacter denitrificans OCh 114]
MAHITKLPSGAYRVQIRRKGRYASETFLRRDDATPKPAKLDPGSIRGWRRSRRAHDNLPRSHRPPHSRYVRGRQTAASGALKTLRRNLGKEKTGHLDQRWPTDCGTHRHRRDPDDHHPCGKASDIPQLRAPLPQKQDTMAADTTVQDIRIGKLLIIRPSQNNLRVKASQEADIMLGARRDRPVSTSRSVLPEGARQPHSPRLLPCRAPLARALAALPASRSAARLLSPRYWHRSQ